MHFKYHYKNEEKKHLKNSKKSRKQRLLLCFRAALGGCDGVTYFFWFIF